ncbi:MAG: helix-turn-helix domain-containing protein [Lachnospiraceae bacterium]|nr:helix-turn-helix domain-containing protein [Lachnospiraceae bacterium]
MTVEDVCESLLIGKNAAYQLLNQGSIKAFRIGSRWKIPRASVIEYILRSRQG